MGSRNGKPVLRDEDIATLSSSSGLNEEEVKSSFKDFVEKHPDGKIKPKDFHQMMSKALPSKDATKMEKNVFRLYDTNNDGSIDFTEFMTTFLIMADGEPEEVLTKIFRVFDVNGDGSITLNEMTKVTTDMYGLLKSKDANLAAKDMVAKAAFAEMDKNHDGKVTLDEFIAACLGQEELSKMLTLKIIDIFVEN
eukprot:TRINITY_DN12473_c0_g1_i1.p1 TRINITY_DN12473_c0_g1~~TRINITY_DN12473_c0_g1_i1.p1  ORF type:complete len:194 (-),score=63.61 TRINITY_DN12473_c0_g1_i1:566-1147(-)